MSYQGEKETQLFFNMNLGYAYVGDPKFSIKNEVLHTLLSYDSAARMVSLEVLADRVGCLLKDCEKETGLQSDYEISLRSLGAANQEGE